MDYADVRKETYGFKDEITADLPSYFIGSNLSKGPSVSPSVCIGFANVDVGAEGSSSIIPFYNLRPRDSEEAQEEVPTVTFQSKFFDSFPLYQDYVLPIVREMCRLEDVVSELVIPERFNGLTGNCRFELCEVELCESEPSKPESLKSPLEKLEFHSLPDQTPPPQSQSLKESPSPALQQSLKIFPYTYWQDLPEVKTSGLLTYLTPKEICLQESMFELIGSEASYLKSLGILVDHFYTSKALKKTLSEMEQKVLFSNTPGVMGASARFLKDLETRLDENPYISQVGDIVLKHSKDFRRHYVPYVTNMAYKELLINQLLERNQGFAYALKKLESDSVCHRHPLKSFLVLPFQRITRIKLLLESILKSTNPDTDSASNLKKAINAIHEILMTCDDNVTKMKKIEELICLEMMMDFGEIKSVPLVISTRRLVHQGSVKLVKVENAYGSRMSFVKIYLHLFNDLLIISSKKNQKFMVSDHALFPAHVSVDHLKADVMGLPQESFLLRLSRSQKGFRTAMILVANTQSDKEEWMKTLSCG
nr:rho guanine nucleotide exchange factor 19 isoform X1 [Nothobranchius furzeri]